ncbi:MAG: hypothetical protein R3C05_13390 [Pirellulaceae bacterium]
MNSRQTHDFLTAATTIDDVNLAQWLLDHFSSEDLSKTELVMARSILLRALLGARADMIDVQFYEDDVVEREKCLGPMEPYNG